MKVCDYVASFLSNEGVETVFSIPGGGCIFLCDSLSRQDEIEVVVNHHEQACAIAAEGYARVKNNIGACLVTSGPGGSNAWTGTLCSYQDSVPVVVISGNVNKSMTTNYTGLSNLRQLGDQEFNVVETVKNFTKYAVQVNDPNKIKYHLQKAFHEARTGRPGPVWIDIPLDVSTSKIDVNSLENFSPKQEQLEDVEYDLIIEKIKTSKKPVFIVGNGVRLSNSIEVLERILEKHKIPVVTSVNGKDNISGEYFLNMGTFGTAGNISANKILQESDLVLSLGSRLYVRQIGYNFKSFAENAFKIYVDIDKEELDKPTLYPNLKANVDVKNFLKTIEDKIEISNIEPWRERCSLIKESSPVVLDRHRNSEILSIYSVLESINEHMHEDLVVVTSDGSANVCGMQVLKTKKKQRLFTNKATAPMGYGLPAAIGASYACKNLKKILCLDGDGSVHMNIQELQVIKQNNLPIKLIIFNNNGFLSIKITQSNYCDGNLFLSTPESGLTLPEYEKIAYAYGIKYHSVKTEDDVKKVFHKIFNGDYDGPEIVEVFVDPNGIHEPKVKASLDESGKFIPGKLENISWS